MARGPHRASFPEASTVSPLPRTRRNGTIRTIVVGLVMFVLGGALGFLVHRPGAEGRVTSSATSSGTFLAVADTYVTEEHPGFNYGDAPEVRTDAAPYIVRSYLRFEVEGLRGDVTMAVLRVFAETNNPVGYDVQAVDSDTWRERTLTYHQSPPLGRLIGSSGAVTGGSWTSVDVSPVVKGDGDVNLALTTVSETMTRYSSREGSNSPELLVRTTRSSPGPGEAAGGSDPSGSGPFASGVGTFSAARSPLPSSGPVVHVAAAGDIACAPDDDNFNGGRGTPTACRMKATSDLLVHAGLDAVLTLGDEQYENGELRNLRESYDPTWGRLKSITHPAVGNHEYGLGSATGFFMYFGAAAGDEARGYYSYDLGAWHLIALNSNCSMVGGCDFGSPQEEWLATDLEEHPSACTLAYWHHPRFSSGPDGNTLTLVAFWQDLYEAGADVVLSGHDHIYERFALLDPAGLPDPERGIREFIVGTGGKNHDSVVTIQQGSELRNDDTYGVLLLTLRPGSYDWRFVPEAGGTFSDEGEGSCH